MSNRIRGKEVLIRIAIDGESQAGSFLKTKDFTFTEDGEIQKPTLLGNDVPELDYMHNGFDFNFTSEVIDAVTLQFLNTIVQRQKDREQHPDIALTLMNFYRDGGSVTSVLLTQCKLRMSEYSAPDQNDFVTASFEGAAREMALI